MLNSQQPDLSSGVLWDCRAAFCAIDAWLYALKVMLYTITSLFALVLQCSFYNIENVVFNQYYIHDWNTYYIKYNT